MIIMLVVGIVGAIAAMVLLGKEKKINGLNVTVAVVILAISITASCVRIVNAGEVGIKYDPFRGGVQEETLGQGIQFTHPFVTVYKLKTTHNLIKFQEFSVQTLDSEYATFIVELKYNMTIENAYKVFNAYKGMPTDSMLQMDIQSAIKAKAPGYNIYDVLGGQFEQLRIEVEGYLSETMLENGLNLVAMNFIDIDAGDLIENAIITKGILKQEKEQATQRIAIAEEDQKSKTITAETAKKVLILEAEAKAEAKLLDATAQAEAMSLIQEQLAKSPEYVDYIKWSAWDGKLPEVVSGEAGTVILDMRDDSSDDIAVPADDGGAEN
ncbi:MAG: hypothetical protein KAG94_06570 [Clostridiales bacterium]|nr:hypothetical protein [Clostridiales bacterium]